MLNTDVKEGSQWFHHSRQMSLVFYLVYFTSSLFSLCLTFFQLSLKLYCILSCCLSSLNIIKYIFLHIIKILNKYYFNTYITFSNYPILLFKDRLLFATTMNIAANISAYKSFFYVLQKLEGLLFFFFFKDWKPFSVA